jgi:hypothetical protein
MDGWYVNRKNTFFHFVSVPVANLTMMVSYVLTIPICSDLHIVSHQVLYLFTYVPTYLYKNHLHSTPTHQWNLPIILDYLSSLLR